MTFSEIWAPYPRKIAKKAAERAWNKLHPSETLAQTIKTSIEHHKMHEWLGRDVKYIPYMATFLHQERWVDGEDIPLLNAEVVVACEGHCCDYCEPIHVYYCLEICSISGDMICPVALEALRQKWASRR